jgi:hypothetical protein
MNLATSSHGNGVIFTQNPPCFWLHLVDWTNYRSRSSSYYTAQWYTLTPFWISWTLNSDQNFQTFWVKITKKAK